MSEDVIVYRIDGADTIINVSDNWQNFARGNAWAGPLPPEDVVGNQLWDFIQDLETRYLYQEVFRRVRAGKPCRPIPFRCDAPDERRFLELILDAFPNEQIEITSRTVRTERRNPVKLLETGTPRSTTDFLKICSMCKKIQVSQEQWAEVEEGLVYLKIFEGAQMPQLTHGICPECYRKVMAEESE